ncbi:MAG: hypothetical protein CMQ84_07355 [Gammaproteobacteria bacterium]|nr:hypothetical protein [Gammaproteobacteria bacterium]OUX77013.1 MAG: hypothetical protein CBC19_08340 [Oceanospirillales bacterium TMED59]
MQIDVIAEGIENNNQYQWLKSHGVHQGQGYYLGPPRIQAIFLCRAESTVSNKSTRLTRKCSR